MRKLAILLTALFLVAGYARAQSTVSGTASISVAVLGLTPSPVSLTFPSQVQGTTSASQPVTLLNTGGGPVSVQSIVVSAQYSQANNCPAILQPNVSCVINVIFSPTGTGVIPGTLTITDNAPDSPETVSLSGTGAASGGGGGVGCGAAGQISCSIGWFQLTNTKLSSVWPSPGSYPDIQAGGGPQNVYITWSGGWADTTRNRAMIWGGGHNDYFGNELYSLNLTANPITLTRLNEPTRNPNTGCGSGAYQDGKPCSRHSYDYMAYSPTADTMTVFGGSLPPGGSFCAEDIWELNSSSLAWTSRGSGNWDCNSVYVGAAYDPNSDSIFFADDHNIFRYNTTTHAMTNVGGGYSARNTLAYSSAVVDPVHKFLFVMGGSGGGGTGGNLYRFNIANPASVPAPTDQYAAANAAGCSAWTGGSSPGGPGVTWYGPRNAIALWSGGSSIGIYDPVNNSCTTVTPSGGPPPCSNLCSSGEQTHGTFGRFNYIPALGVFSLCNDPTLDCWAARIDTSADTNFANRCAQPGVLQCQGFDTATTFSTTASQAGMTSGFLGNSPNTPTRDTAVFASGSSSAEWKWPANLSSDNCCKDYWGMFGEAGANVTFGNNTTFYVQFAWRGDTNYTTPGWMADFPTSYPKVAIMENTRNGSCGNGSLVLGNFKAHDNPDAYTNCGGFGLFTCNGTTWNGNNGCGASPEQFQQGYLASSPFTGYECLYSNGTFTQGTHGLGCFAWQANTWYTMYYKVTMGTSGSANSTVEAWVAPYGQQLKKLLDVHNVTIQLDNFSPAGFNYIEMTSFATGHSAGNLAANSWVDELIISSQPICPTGGVSPDGIQGCPQ